ncbi:hypothetical protein MNBD_GAMMA23-1141 [hydrothermal vent metagenome]|uniref:Uncharacterized protein n=1 Tax=hydrothermal vent metagenome TaxID=652676 RepID=A0A3B1ANX1_9ZZZZ
MIKTFKQSKQTSLSLVMMFLFLNGSFAQSIIFSSDQWPKRWERTMQQQPMNGYIIPAKMKNFKNINQPETRRYQGWGKQQSKQRYQRSRTPDYNYRLRNKYEAVPLSQRYAIPESLNYGGYPVRGYYGNSMPVYPMYPGLGLLGSGMPGFAGMGLPYASPFYMAPGLYPGMGYP